MANRKVKEKKVRKVKKVGIKTAQKWKPQKRKLQKRKRERRDDVSSINSYPSVNNYFINKNISIPETESVVEKYTEKIACALSELRNEFFTWTEYINGGIAWIDELKMEGFVQAEAFLSGKISTKMVLTRLLISKHLGVTA